MFYYLESLFFIGFYNLFPLIDKKKTDWNIGLFGQIMELD